MRSVTELYDLPKDMLIKIITTIQSDISRETKIDKDIIDTYSTISDRFVTNCTICDAIHVTPKFSKQLETHPWDAYVVGREDSPIFCASCFPETKKSMCESHFNEERNEEFVLFTFRNDSVYSCLDCINKFNDYEKQFFYRDGKSKGKQRTTNGWIELDNRHF